jgi:hypothetical protein
MVTRRVIATCLVAVALCVQVCGDETRKVSGRVVDEAGQPVTGAEVATMWDGVGGTAMRASSRPVHDRRQLLARA